MDWEGVAEIIEADAEVEEEDSEERGAIAKTDNNRAQWFDCLSAGLKKNAPQVGSQSYLPSSVELAIFLPKWAP